MTGFVPAGMLPFPRALGRVAQERCAAAWEDAKPEERAFLADGAPTEGFSLTLWTRESSVAGRAYRELRPMLAAGTVPTLLRGLAGAPTLIDPAAWHASGADRLANVLRGTIEFGDAGRGDVLIRAVDLDAALRGEPVPKREPERTDTAPRAEKKVGGRPPKAGVDDFWIEVCRLIYAGEQGAKGQTQKQFVDAMLGWSTVNQSDPYKADAVEQKLKKLWKSLDIGR